MNCSYVINTGECICVRNEHFSNQNDSDQNDNNQTEHFKQSSTGMAWRGNKIAPELMNIAKGLSSFSASKAGKANNIGINNTGIKIGK